MNNLKMMRYLVLPLFLAVFMLACSSSGGRKISGNVNHANNLNMYFEQYNPVSNQNTVLAKTETKPNGDFEMKIPENLDPGFYRVRIGTKMAYLILDGETEDLEFFGDLEQLDMFEYSVNGSSLTQEFQFKMSQYVRRYVNAQHIITYAASHASPLVGMLIACISMKTASFAGTHRMIADKVNSQYGDLNLEFVSNYENLVTQFEKSKPVAESMPSGSGKIQIGEEAPEINLPDPSGNYRKLSDLKGKVVLLDFWASWCGPCRKANPHVVATYEKYRDQGFTVYSVSLDGLDERSMSRFGEEQLEVQLQRSKERWLQAIKQDNLVWEYHVSDLKKWDSVAADEYGVRSIPRTFLIDRDGKIAAINPRNNLEEQLIKVLEGGTSGG